MDFTSICRTCLSSEDLTPLFTNTADAEQNRYTEAVFYTAGVKIEADDGYPQQICKSCIEFLDKAWKFRQKCIETEHTLIEFQNEPNSAEVTIEINLKTEHLVKSESIEDYETEYIDFDVLEDEDKPLKHLIKEDIAKTVSEKEVCTPISNRRKKKQKNVTITKKEDLLFTIDSANRVTCKLCYKNLSVRSIDTHMAKKHPGADKRKDKCELCDKYIMKCKMGRHMSMSHAGSVTDKCFRCGYCKAEFLEKQLLVDHVATCTAKVRKRSIHEPGRQMVECDVCSKKMQKASLNMHKAVKHAGLGPVCEHCGKRFGNKLRLKEHYRARHGYEKLKCNLCDFTSASESALRNHERRHRNEKPFVCEACGAGFHAAYLLAQHRQSHRAERLLKCNLCPAAFKANNSLHTHKRSCHGAARHACSMCARAYSCRHYAVRHLRLYHRYSGPVPPLRTTRPEETGEGIKD